MLVCLIRGALQLIVCNLLIVIDSFRVFLFTVHGQQLVACSRDAVRVHATRSKLARNAFARQRAGCRQRSKRDNYRGIHHEQARLVPARMMSTVTAAASTRMVWRACEAGLEAGHVRVV